MMTPAPAPPRPASPSLPLSRALGALLALSACGTPQKEATFANIQPILTRSCSLSSSCHQSAITQTGNIKLAAGSAYCALLGTQGGATYRMAAQGAFPRRVVPGDRQRSFLYKKLILTDGEMGASKDLGTRMPQGATLDAEEVDLFGRWIDGGALNENGVGPTAAGCM